MIGSSVKAKSDNGITHSNQYDRWGGWKGLKFDPTGFFRVQKADRWWLVTPEGNAFLSFGINHLHLGFFMQDYQSTQIAKMLGISSVHNRDEFWPALRNWFFETCEDFGFNTVGVYNNPLDEMINNPKPVLPYIQPIRFVDIPNWKTDIPDENFKDIFSAEMHETIFRRDVSSCIRGIIDIECATIQIGGTRNDKNEN